MLPPNYTSLDLRQIMHRTAHVILTWVMLWLCYVFSDDYPTFLGNKAFGLFAEIAPEHVWGMVAGIVALIGISTFFTRNWVARTIAATILSIAHFGVAGLFYLGNPHGTATGAYVGYAILGAILAYSTAHLGYRLAARVEPPCPPG